MARTSSTTLGAVSGLLVLDDFEHLLAASDAVRARLAPSRTLRVVVCGTNSAVFGLVGARIGPLVASTRVGALLAARATHSIYQPANEAARSSFPALPTWSISMPSTKPSPVDAQSRQRVWNQSSW